MLRIPVDALRELLATGPDVALSVVRTAVARLRAMESTLREREKLAALGTLSAGLAHELNNPAAAALRSVAALEDAVHAAESLPRPSPPPRPPADTRAAAKRAGSGRPDQRARGRRGERRGRERPRGGRLDGRPPSVSSRPDVVPWLAADASVRQLLGELEIALTRIRDIVGAVKGYTYLDQAPVGRVDVRIGLEQTLVILRHRLRDIDVRTEIADDLPQIEAYGSELNQVWTNLIDNAVDAMDGRGTLTVAAEPEPDAGGDRGAGHDRRLGLRHPAGHPRPALRAVLHHQGAGQAAPGSGSTSRTA